MSEEGRNTDELKNDLLRRLDPGGEMGELMKAFAPLADSQFARGMLGLLGVSQTDLTAPLDQADRLLTNMAGAILTFAPAGWAPSSQVPADLYDEALSAYRKNRSLDEAEDHLIKGWNSENRLTFLLNRIKGLGAGNEPLHRIYMRRWELVDRALKHHEAGAFEASVPIVLAQADGIVWDLTEPPRGLFTARGERRHLVDEGTVAGVPEGLRPLSALFSEGMQESGMTGKLSRQGILHGRELGYDTLINSTKSFVLLVAVIEWAQPRARELAEKLMHEREVQFAGSQETDEDGRWLDRRGFKEATESLQRLGMIQMGQWRNNGRYGDDIESLQPGQLGDSRMHGKGNIHLVADKDGREYRAWRSTPSGFHFGIAGRDGPPNEWRYAGLKPPPDDLETDEWLGLEDPWPLDW